MLFGLLNSIQESYTFFNSQEFSVKLSILIMLAISTFCITGILCNAASYIGVISRYVILFEMGLLCTEFGSKFMMTYHTIPSFLRDKKNVKISNIVFACYNCIAGIYCFLRHRKRFDIVGMIGAVSLLVSGLFYIVVIHMASKVAPVELEDDSLF